jgi:hypothetical protein
MWEAGNALLLCCKAKGSLSPQDAIRVLSLPLCVDEIVGRSGWYSTGCGVPGESGL